MKRTILICVLIVGVPLVAYALGLPDRYIEGLFLLFLLIYLVPLAYNKTNSMQNRRYRDD